MRGRLLLLVAILALAAVPSQAHVGSPNVFYDGDAGPYPVRVIVRPPAVIPGDAEVTVRLRDGREAERVTLRPVLFSAGLKGAPPPDEAQRVPGAPGVWSGQFLLMREGSWSVRVHVQGREGEGTTQVAMPAVRSQIFKMDKRLGAFLAGLGLFLFAGAVAVVGAAVREASLPPGERADARRLSRARAVAALSAVVLALMIWGGKIWWDGAEGKLRKKLFEPYGLLATIPLDASPRIELTIEDPGTRSWSPLIPDHGKLMHLFLVREPALDAFAHLHPVAQGQKDFLSALPPLPAGNYRVYADIVDENGLPQTLVDQVEIPAQAAEAASERAPGDPSLEPDDSWSVAEPLRRSDRPSQLSRLENGGTMLWHQEPLKANRETTLRFEVRDANGASAPLEPYMGMLGHAVINRDDGEVFVHLHPMGTLNMAAQRIFAQAQATSPAKMDHSSMAAMDHSEMPGMDHSMGQSGAGSVSFPYEFPQPGLYRVWVQVKSAGQILTGVFTAQVGES